MSLKLLNVFNKLHISQKKATIFGAVVQICSIILLFVPRMYVKYATVYLAESEPIGEDRSFMFLFGECQFDVHVSIILLVLFVVLMFINMVLIAISLFKNFKWCNSKWLVSLPVITLVLFMSFSLWADKNMVNLFTLNSVLITTSVDLGILFYIECSLLFIVIINDICKKFLSLPKTIASSKKTHNLILSEIESYKNMLDSELITQEEFEMKKKQLLEI